MSAAPSPSLASYLSPHLAKIAKKSNYLTFKYARDNRVITEQGGELVNFVSNDYLGLATEPMMRQALQEFLAKDNSQWGAGSSRLLCGNSQAIEKLERELATFCGYQQAMLFPSASQANLTLWDAILKPLREPPNEPIVYSDIHNHASINQGLKLARARVRHFRHNDLAHLEKLLKQDSTNNARFIISETIFSMEGLCIDTQALEALAQKYNAFLVLDDAHGFGMFGENGEGLAGGKGEMAVLGLGKGAGLWGGAVLMKDAALKPYLMRHCSGMVYTTAVSPLLVCLATKMLQLLPTLEARRSKIKRLSQILRSQLPQAKGEAHIISLVLGAKAPAVAEKLLSEGFYAKAILPPTVPKGVERLRLSITANHSEQQIRALAVAIKAAIKNAYGN